MLKININLKAVASAAKNTIGIWLHTATDDTDDEPAASTLINAHASNNVEHAYTFYCR